jgi:hypothetical protein
MPRPADRFATGRAILLFGLVLGAGLGLRVWGIAFAGSTPLGRPDEEIFAVEGLAMFARSYSRLATGWPDGFFMVWHAMLRLERAWFHLVYGDGTINLGCLLTIRPLALILPVRVLSALLGTATAFVVGLIAASLAPSRAREAALWASSIYAVNYLVGRDAHFAVSDTALCLGIALTLLACVHAAAGRLAWLPWAGFFAGCSFSMKYSAVGLAIPCVVAGGIAVVRRRRAAIRPLLLAVAAAIAGVIVLAPQVLTHWSDFKQGLLGLSDRYGPGTGPLLAPRGWTHYPFYVLPVGFGLAGYVLCVAGLAGVTRKSRWQSAPLATYVLGFYVLLLGPLRLVFARYGSPIVPALAAAGGAFAVQLVDVLCARVALPRLAATTVLAILTLSSPAIRLARFDRLLARADTRDLARDWLVVHGAGKTVLTEGGLAHVQAVEARHAQVCQEELPAGLWRPTPILSVSRQPTLRGRGEPGWGAIGFGGSRWYVFDEADQRAFLPDLHAETAPDFLAQARGSRSLAVSGEQAWGTRDPVCWHEAAHFDPGDLEAAQWDTYDAFHTPFDGISALRRPGPEIFIYENRCKSAGPSSRSPATPSTGS